jgi:hypothetical protein
MFCQHCGFQYTQKTKYCKNCGGDLSSSDKAPVTQPSNLKISGMFLVIAAFALFGLMQVYEIYMKTLYAGVRGNELFVPFLLGLALIGAVALLLVWQLSRVITVFRNQVDQVTNQERPIYVEVPPPANLAAPTDPIRNAVESPSVVEHTTRRMAGVYKAPSAPE